LAALIGVAVSAGATQAFGNPSESRASPVASTVGDFASALKAKSEEAWQNCGQALAHGQAIYAELKRRQGIRLEALSATLSEQKARLATMREEAAATFATWQQAAGEKWAAWQHAAFDALGSLAEWMHKQSAPNEASNIGT
jgi:hypothetical protein